jgi:hypothetical protein
LAAKSHRVIAEGAMDIQDELERIHAAKVAGKPLMHCLREVVRVVAHMHGATGDEIHRRAFQAAWEAAVNYGWAVTAVERATVRFHLQTYTTQWISEALSPLYMFKRLTERHGTDKAIQRVIELLGSEHGVTRSTVLAWRRTEEGKPVSKPLKSETRARITEAVRCAFSVA